MIRAHRKQMRRGLTIVETTIVIALVMLIIFGIYEYGRFVMVRQVVQNAAREGARLAVVSANTLETVDIQNRVSNYLAGQQLNPVTIQVYWADPNTGAYVGNWKDASFGQGIAVDVNGTYRPVLPSLLFMSATIPVQVRAVMYSEAN